MPVQGMVVIAVFVLAVVAVVGLLLGRRKRQINRDLARMAEMLGGTWARSLDGEEEVDRLEGTLEEQPVSITYRRARTYPNTVRLLLERPAPGVEERVEVLMSGPWFGEEARRRKEELRSTGDRKLDRKVKILGDPARSPENLAADDAFRTSALHLVGREYDTVIEDGHAVAAMTLHDHHFRISAEDNRRDLEALGRLIGALAET